MRRTHLEIRPNLKYIRFYSPGWYSGIWAELMVMPLGRTNGEHEFCPLLSFPTCSPSFQLSCRPWHSFHTLARHKPGTHREDVFKMFITPKSLLDSFLELRSPTIWPAHHITCMGLLPRWWDRDLELASISQHSGLRLSRQGLVDVFTMAGKVNLLSGRWDEWKNLALNLGRLGYISKPRHKVFKLKDSNFSQQVFQMFNLNLAHRIIAL